MRIHIIGGSGSGKSYISNEIAKMYGLRVINLDNIEWDKSEYFSKKRSIEEKEKILKETVKEDNIIVEGVYYNWCNESFKVADYIFFINTKIFTQQKRIILRSIKRKLGIEKCNFKESLKSIRDLLKWNKKYNTVLKKEIFEILEVYKNKVYTINCTNDIFKIIGE